jgi:hypothetical protein
MDRFYPPDSVSRFVRLKWLPFVQNLWRHRAERRIEVCGFVKLVSCGASGD